MSTDVTPIHTGRRRRRAVLTVVVVLAVAAGAGAFLVLRDDGKPSLEWDPQIEPFAEIVEKRRGLEFDHPVKVRFLDDEEFEKTVRADEDDLDKDDRQEIEESTALFRAFGLIAGDVDLFDSFNEARGSGTLAYYSYKDRAITVRGKKLTRASHSTLVHELTHALQDQRFDIGKTSKRLSKEAADGEPTTAIDVFDAVVEGDAERVAERYVRSLSAKDRKALQKAEEAESDADDTEKELEAVPDVVEALIGAPYVLGRSLIETAASNGGVDALYKDPPPDDSYLFDPLKALDDVPDPVSVKIPKLGSGEKTFDSGQIGTLLTYLMLAERIPLKEALTATDAWTGDAYVGFRRDDVLCVRVDYAAASSKGAALITKAFTDWISASSGAPAKVEQDGRRVTFESCDPGKGAKLVNDAASDAIGLLATRSVIGSQVVSAGGDAAAARCFSREVIEAFSVEDLADPEFGVDDPDVVKKVQGLALSCR